MEICLFNSIYCMKAEYLYVTYMFVISRNLHLLFLLCLKGLIAEGQNVYINFDNHFCQNKIGLIQR